MQDELKNNQTEQEPEQEQEQEAVDPIVLLGRELAEIRQALGLGSDVGNSSLLKRLDTIEQKLSKPQEQRNLPEAISWEQAGSLSFMRKAGISLDDISSGRVQVTRD